MEGKLRPDFRGEVLTVLEEEEVEVEEEAGTWGSLAEDSTFRGTFSTLTARIGLGGREIKKALYCTKGGCVSYFIYCVLILTNLSTKFTYTPSKQANTSGLLPFPSRFAFHLLDILGFFRGLEMVLGTLSPADMNFQEMITKYFVHFAKEGKLIVRFSIIIAQH